MVEFPGLGARGRIPPVRAVMVLAAAAVAAICLGVVLLLWDLHEREIGHARGEISSLSGVLAEQTTRAFDGIDLVVRSVQDRMSDNIGQKLTLDSTMVHLLLHARTAGMPQLASVFVVDAEGFVCNSSRQPGIARRSVADREYFSVWRQGGSAPSFFGRPTRNRIDGKWTVHISRPLFDLRGDLRGVVVADVDLGYFESLYSSIRLDFASPITLHLRDGTLVATYPQNDAAVGTRIADLSRLGVRADEREAPLVSEVSGWMSAYRPVNKYPLAIGVSVNEGEVLDNWRHDCWRVGLGAALCAVLILLAAWALAWELRKEESLLSALRASHLRLRQLAASQQDVREKERARIARELHDELGQKLTGLKLEISWLAGQITKQLPGLTPKIDEMKQLLGDTIEETRRISSELRPLMLDDLGFGPAAEWMAQGFSRRTGIAARLDLRGADEVKGDPLATVLFRVLQESLTNVARHSGADAVEVLLERQGDRLRMRIRDNGRGLPDEPRESRRGGFGVLGMRERVLAVGGSVTVENAPEGGVCVEVNVPLAMGGGDEQIADIAGG